MPDSGHIDRTKINAGTRPEGVVSLPAHELTPLGRLLAKDNPRSIPLPKSAVDVKTLRTTERRDPGRPPPISPARALLHRLTPAAT